MARRVITLKGDPVIHEDEIALEVFTPGHLLELTPTGVLKNTADGEINPARFALERDEVGRDIDFPYATNDVVKVGAFAPGQRVYAFLASGQNAVKGDYLTSGAPNGTLAVGTVANAIGMALEAVNSVSDTTRIRTEIV